jgi:hypothetical protein
LAAIAPTFGSNSRSALKPGSKSVSLPPFTRLSSARNAMPSWLFSAVSPTRPLYFGSHNSSQLFGGVLIFFGL